MSGTPCPCRSSPCRSRRQGNVRGLVLIGLAAVVVAAAAGQGICAEPVLSQYFEQLRQRQLFRMAEGIGLRQLARGDLSPQLRAQYTLELSRTFAEHAKFSPQSERLAFWKQARQIVADLLKHAGKVSKRQQFWLQVQHAVVRVSQGEFQRWEAALFPEDDALRQTAIDNLDKAISELNRLEHQLDVQRSRLTRKRRNAPVGVTATDVRMLFRHVRYQLAIALLNKAELSPPGSKERTSQASLAMKPLSILVKGPEGEPITLFSRVMEATAYRLAEDVQRAADRLTAILRTKPPLSVYDRTIGERARLLLAMNKPDNADSMLTELKKLRRGLPGELALLKVQSLIARWRISRKQGNRDESANLFKEAEAQAAETERNLGGFWAYRCRTLLKSANDARVYGDALSTLIRKAQVSFRRRQFAESVRDYNAAARLARRSGRVDLAVKLRFTQASIALQDGEYTTAATVFAAIAGDHPQHPRAADAHLMWTYCLGRLYEGRQTKTNRLAYTQALEQHRKRFTESPTVHEAAWMLATLYERRLQVTVARKLYQSIPAGHSRGVTAQAAVARCFEKILERLRELKRPKDLADWENYAVSELGRVAAAFPRAPVKLRLSQAEVIVRFARISLNRLQPDYANTDRQLLRVFQSQPVPAKTPSQKEKSLLESWRRLTRIARQLRIISLAGSGRITQARKLVDGLSHAGSAEVLEILDGLMQLAGGANAQTRKQLGSLQLQAALKLNRKRDSLKPDEQVWLDRCLAQAYAASGRSDLAVKFYEQLLAKSPRNPQLLKTAAALMMKSSDRKTLAQAKTLWLRLQPFHVKGSREWLHTRYNVALAAFRLKQFSECRKLLTVTKLLYPNLGDARLREQYAKLLAEAKKM
ncbi:MAG: hypothetical protein IID45_05360 [Planctomycetes bacterium]|nr:hypothetical protein [Planctomycetota bacterium]